MDNKQTEKVKANLNKMSMADLLAYRDSVHIVLGYYDNLAKANVGEYDDFKKNDYVEALREVNKYKDLSQIVFDVIKEKVNSI